MFGDLPVDVDELRGADDAAVIDAVTGWARVGAAADARKYAAIAESSILRGVPVFVCHHSQSELSHVAGAVAVAAA